MAVPLVRRNIGVWRPMFCPKGATLASPSCPKLLPGNNVARAGGELRPMELEWLKKKAAVFM
jgi:hypothetical protein